MHDAGGIVSANATFRVRCVMRDGDSIAIDHHTGFRDALDKCSHDLAENISSSLPILKSKLTRAADALLLAIDSLVQRPQAVVKSARLRELP